MQRQPERAAGDGPSLAEPGVHDQKCLRPDLAADGKLQVTDERPALLARSWSDLDVIHRNPARYDRLLDFPGQDREGALHQGTLVGNRSLLAAQFDAALAE